MRKICMACISLLFTQVGFSQANSFSTLGQVFNFAVGDSFEYTNTEGGLYDIDGSTGMFSCTSIGLMVIRSVSNAGDSLRYTYTYVYQASPDNDGVCNPGLGYEAVGFPPFPTQLGNWGPAYTPGINNSDSVFSVYAPDSLTTFLWGQCPLEFGCSDTSFSDSVYNYHQQNEFNDNNLSYDGMTFADSLGMVSMGWWVESGWNSYQQQLIWYHKANGEQWGQRVSIIPEGIDALNDPLVSAKLYPNPSNGNFTFQMSMLYKDDNYLTLFDASGRKVYNRKISEMATDIQLTGISPGLYLWQLQFGNNVAARGKLVLQ